MSPSLNKYLNDERYEIMGDESLEVDIILKFISQKIAWKNPQGMFQTMNMLLSRHEPLWFAIRFKATLFYATQKILILRKNVPHLIPYNIHPRSTI